MQLQQAPFADAHRVPDLCLDSLSINLRGGQSGD